MRCLLLVRVHHSIALDPSLRCFVRMRRQLSCPGTASPPAEPQAEQRPLERTLHDLRLIDEYTWLKAENWREVMRNPVQLDPAIRAYLQAENDYCERALADPDGPYAYYVRYRKEGQHPLLCRERPHSLHFPDMQAADVNPEEQLLLDGDALAHGKAFFRLGATRHSPDHRLLAWLADEAGSEFYTARVRAIDSGADLADVVPDASSAVVWTQDASAFYYVRLDQNHRPDGVFRHRVFTEADPGFFISIGRHSSGRFGDISAHDHETSEAWLIDPSVPNLQAMKPTPALRASPGTPTVRTLMVALSRARDAPLNRICRIAEP